MSCNAISVDLFPSPGVVPRLGRYFFVPRFRQPEGRDERDAEACGDPGSRMLSATAGSPAPTRISTLARLRACAAISSTPPSPRITAASSNAPATARSSSSAASSTPCAARSRCRTRWSSATPACRPNAVSSSAIGVHLGDVVEESGRRPDGRRGQYRRAAGGHLRAGRRSVFPRTPTGGQVAARTRGRRPRAAKPQEHRRAGARLRCCRQRRAGAGQNRPPQPATRTRGLLRPRWPALAARLRSRFLRRAPRLARGLRAALHGRFRRRQARRPRRAFRSSCCRSRTFRGDKEQDYFADGITDDLTTDLSHLPDSFVIARNTAFTYKGKPVDAKQIGSELGVRYALEGSVRRVGDTVDDQRAAHLDRDRRACLGRPVRRRAQQLGELQVEAVARLANSLGVELVKAEALRAMRERPNNPDAVDLAMRAIANTILHRQ